MDVKAVEQELNSFTPGAFGDQQLGSNLVHQKVQVVQAGYDFAVQGGAVSTINLYDPLLGTASTVVIPSGAIIKQVLINVITPCTTSASGTMNLTAQSAADLKAALAAASWTGLVAGIPVGTAATMIKMTADRTLTTAIATGAITAGKFDVIVEFYSPVT